MRGIPKLTEAMTWALAKFAFIIAGVVGLRQIPGACGDCEMKVALKIGLFVGMALAVAGCGGGDATTPQNRRFGALEFNLTTPKTTYMRGEQVPLTFTVKNVGSQTINVTRAACEFFDTKVTSGSTVVWQTSQTHGCAGVLIDISIAPGETKTYSYIWPQTDMQGDQVPAGSYTLSSWYQPYNRSDETLLPGNQETNDAAFPVRIVVQ